MKARVVTYMLLSFVGLACSVTPVRAESDLPLWDTAVSRLLAAGLYGMDSPETSTLTLGPAVKPFPAYAADKIIQDGRRITFSYEGSSGVLGFSAGYINTEGMDSGRPGAVFLGLDDPMDSNAGTSPTSLYWSLDLLTTYQATDALVFGIGGRSILLDNSSGPEQERVLSFLLNLPVSYKNLITITPELQWSRSLPLQKTDLSTPGDVIEVQPEDEFYGGLSISFSY